MSNDPLPISVTDIDRLWKTVENNVLTDSSLKTDVLINGLSACLEIQVDPGTGLSRSGELSCLTATIPNSDNFEFIIRSADPIDQIIKIFSKNNVSTGIDVLDKRLVVKSNNERIVRQLFGNPELEVLFNLQHTLNFSIRARVLQLKIDTALVTRAEFETFYHAFIVVVGMLVT